MKSTLALPALAIVIMAAIANHDCEAAAMGEITGEMRQIPNPGATADGNHDETPEGDKAAPKDRYFYHDGTPNGILDGAKAIPEKLGCLSKNQICNYARDRCCSGNCRKSGWNDRPTYICD